MGEQSENLPLDATWHARFKECRAVATFDWLEGEKSSREEQRAKFLSGEIQNPTLDYPRLNDVGLADLKERETKLLALKTDLLAQEPNEVIGRAYRWRINEAIAAIRMLRVVQAGDMRKFRRYSEFIYGKPSAEVFNYTVRGLRTEAQKYLDSDNNDLSRAASDFLAVLPRNLPETTTFNFPEQADIDSAGAAITKEFGDLINVGPLGSELEPDEIKAAFQKALDSLKAEGWEVVLSSRKTAISVIQADRKVEVPESRRIPLDRLAKLIVHEIGTHVKRRINGERSKLALLGSGLDRYDPGEEGVATLREQVLSGSLEDFAGLGGHLAISLAVGLDGQPRDFRGVFEVLKRYHFLKQLAKSKTMIEATAEASNDAWAHCVRTFRGTDCTTPGVCYTKDIGYREGNIGVWRVVRTKPDEMLRFSVGKYDPANPRHISILEQLGISEKDLKDLDE